MPRNIDLLRRTKERLAGFGAVQKVRDHEKRIKRVERAESGGGGITNVTNVTSGSTTAAALTVQEEDGTPIDTAVTIIRFPNGSVTDNGAGDVSIAFTGGSAHTIKENGTSLTARTGLNFLGGLHAKDDSGGNETEVSWQPAMAWALGGK